MSLTKIKEPDDPNRCQGVIPSGQCYYLRTEGSKFCTMHAGPGNNDNRDKALSLKLYKLGKWQARLDELDEHPDVKTLRGEIGIARMTLETIVSKCNDEHELLMYSQKISDLVGRIEKLVNSCHRLEEKSGVLLDKSSILQFCGTTISIITDYITDPDTLSLISDRLIEAVKNASVKRTITE